MRTFPGLTCLLALCAPFTLCASALASPLFETIGSLGGGGGFNGRADAPGASAAYFNPALLARAPQGLSLGVLLVREGIAVSLDARDASVNVPEAVVGRAGTDLPPLPTGWLEQGCEICPAPAPRQGQGSSGVTRGYQSIGLVTRPWDPYLTLGMYALVPYGSFTTGHSFFVDEREQFFTNSLHPELYGDRLTAVSLAFGAATRIGETLSLGVSFTLGLVNEAQATSYVGNSVDVPGTLQLSNRIDVLASVAPHFAASWRAMEDLELSLVVHTPQEMVIDTQFGSYLPSGSLDVAQRTATHGWLPWTPAVGGRWGVWKGGGHSLALVGNLRYAGWSAYVNRQSERPHSDYPWTDTFPGSVGLRHRFEGGLQSGVDLQYAPTPVPPQTGRSNYVDNDRMAVAASVSRDFPTRWNNTFRVSLSAQLHHLFERYQRKFDPRDGALVDGYYPQLVVDEWPDSATDASGNRFDEAQGLQTNNPGWPGFSSGGMLFGAGFNVALLY